MQLPCLGMVNLSYFLASIAIPISNTRYLLPSLSPLQLWLDSLPYYSALWLVAFVAAKLVLGLLSATTLLSSLASVAPSAGLDSEEAK